MQGMDTADALAHFAKFNTIDEPDKYYMIFSNLGFGVTAYAVVLLATRQGRIPGAILLDWTVSVDYSKNSTIKSTKDLIWDFEKDDIMKDKNIIVYCQSGVRSSHVTSFLTQILGYENVKNYDGSWIEWSFYTELPIEMGVSDSQYDGPSYTEIISRAYSGYAKYLFEEILNPNWHNYFYWLLLVSAFFFILELFAPWRIEQAKFRKDFWLDFFYMFFNFFLFSLIIYNALSEVFVNLFSQGMAIIGITNLLALEVKSWPIWVHLLLGFVVRDFIQWWVHRLLHRVPLLWEFHKVHHSVVQMGFAAHLRYHFMENIVYRTLEYIPLAMIGIGLNDFFIIHIITLAIGHWNHTNFNVNIGPLKYIFNNPGMHIWHHSYVLPKDKPYGINFGLSLSIWDYLFKTNYIPFNGRDIELGFEGDENLYLKL